MIDELESIWNQMVVVYLMFYHGKTAGALPEF
jgi:hypothetical protein